MDKNITDDNILATCENLNLLIKVFVRLCSLAELDLCSPAFTKIFKEKDELGILHALLSRIKVSDNTMIKNYYDSIQVGEFIKLEGQCATDMYTRDGGTIAQVIEKQPLDLPSIKVQNIEGRVCNIHSNCGLQYFSRITEYEHIKDIQELWERKYTGNLCK